MWYKTIPILCDQPFLTITDALRTEQLHWGDLVKTDFNPPINNHHIWVELTEEQHTNLTEAGKKGLISSSYTLKPEDKEWIANYFNGIGSASVPFLISALCVIPVLSLPIFGVSILEAVTHNSGRTENASQLATLIAAGGTIETRDFLRNEKIEGQPGDFLFFHTTLHYKVVVGLENRSYLLDQCKYAVADR